MWQLSACYAVKYAVDWQRELINAFVLDDTTAAPHGGHEEEDEVRGQGAGRRQASTHNIEGPVPHFHPLLFISLLKDGGGGCRGELRGALVFRVNCLVEAEALLTALAQVRSQPTTPRHTTPHHTTPHHQVDRQLTH